MEFALAAAIAVALGFWFAASAIHQLSPPWWHRISAVDRLRLLPQWHFFAPRPGRNDYHLVVRDILDGDAGPWREIPTGDSPPVRRWLLNPYRYRQKALSDLINTLLEARRLIAAHGVDQDSERLSLPYLAILAWAVAQPAAVHPCQRQFAIVASAGHQATRELRVIYLSAVHSLEDDRAG